MVKEHRLALVLNGGISLSIWMGGVASELDLVRRASSPDVDDPPLKGKQLDVLRKWKAACAKKPRIVLDIIAGTSAGGLNGVFLAAAIARNGTLDSLKELWMDRAQLDGHHLHLLDPGRPTVNSILNGDAFLNGVVYGLQRITPISNKAGKDVSLITTASAAGGPSPFYRDSRETPFQLPDHRRRYRFRRGPGPLVTAESGPPLALVRDKNVRDFGLDAADAVDALAAADALDAAEAADTADALAKAARATASIPGVFDPVPETPALRRHRRLPAPEVESSLDYLLDGGLLDNAPFDAVLDAIGKQSVDSTWKRTLGYIVPAAPDPAVQQQAPGPVVPSWTEIVPKIFTYPGEGNLRDGIGRLALMMEAAQPDVDVRRFADLLTGDDLSRVTDGAERLFPYYKEAAARAGLAEALDAASGSDVHTLRPDSMLDVSGIVQAPQTWLPGSVAYTPGDEWHWGVAAADRLVRLFLRSISGLEGPGQDDRRARLHEITEELHAIRKIVGAELDSKPFNPLSAANIAVVISHVYDELGIPERLGERIADASGQVAAAYGVDAKIAARAGLSLLVVNGASGLPVNYTPTPIFDFLRFDVRLPMNLFGLAALQTDPGFKNPSDILYGTRLGHFAAFGKKPWREWDWLWGRISATVHLCDLLEIPDQATDLIQAIVEAEGFSEEQVTAEASALLLGVGTKSMDLFEQMRTAGGTVGPAAEAALRMGDRWSVAPSLPGVAGVAGSVIATIVGRVRPARSDAVQPPAPAMGIMIRVLARAARSAMAPYRRALWWWLRS